MTVSLDWGRIALGTVPLGNFRVAIDDERATATVDAAWRAGIRYFDTAPLYGSGLAERRLGDALRGHPRDQFLLSTKVGNRLDAEAAVRADLMDAGEPIYRDIPPLQPVVDFRAGEVRRSLEGSLQRLGVDRVDMVLLHDPAADSPHLAEAIKVIDGMRNEGMIGAVGVGGSDVDALDAICDVISIDVFLEAGLISILEHRLQERISRTARERGIHVIAAGVFHSGILAAPDPAASTYFYRRASREVVERVLRVRRICADHGVDPLAAAVQYPLRVAGVGTVLLGAAAPDEIVADVEALDAVIPDDFWAEFDDQERAEPGDA